jgi:predicted ribosome quality control (RQC) complex YloA/Tae2 family protein
VFDSLTVAALVDELSNRLLGGHIQKVLQLDAESIGFEIYAEHQRQYLVASANSRNPRLYLSSTRLSADPSSVSPLLLLLRKYARGAEIVSIQQPPLERVVRMSIAKRFFMDKKRDLDEVPDESDDVGEIVYSELVIEIMGRRSNVILTSETGRIYDSIKRVTPEMSRIRPILPGRQYETPPPQQKLDPRGLHASDVSRLLRDVEIGTDLSTTIVSKLAGFSPQMAREVVYRAVCDPHFALPESPVSNELGESLAEAITSLLQPLETSQWEPTGYLDDEGQLVAYAPTRFEYLANTLREERLPSISAAVERVVETAAEPTSMRHGQRRAQLVAEIEEGVKRAASRVHSIEQEQIRAREVEHWRESGEAIYAHIYEIAPGQDVLEANGRRIELDPSLTASENAQAYFERYRKAQTATEHLPQLEQEARATLDYLQQLRTMAELSEGIDQIEAVRQEWLEWRRPKQEQGGKKGPSKTRRKQPVALRSERGDTVYVGHSGAENETVTFELGGPDDVWVHARGVPGGHVIVRWAGEESDDVLVKAAALAAWYSAGRSSTTVEVDATQRRYVRKIKGAGPGMVTYRNEQTLNVRPQSPEDLGWT